MCNVLCVLWVHAQVDEVKGIMTENIDKMLARGEKLELLTDKTENLMFEVSTAIHIHAGWSGWVWRTCTPVPQQRASQEVVCCGPFPNWNVFVDPHLPACPCATCAPAPQADRFVRTGRTLRRQMWWQNCKMKVGGKGKGGVH